MSEKNISVLKRYAGRIGGGIICLGILAGVFTDLIHVMGYLRAPVVFSAISIAIFGNLANRLILTKTRRIKSWLLFSLFLLVVPGMLMLLITIYRYLAYGEPNEFDFIPGLAMAIVFIGGFIDIAARRVIEAQDPTYERYYVTIKKIMGIKKRWRYIHTNNIGSDIVRDYYVDDYST